MELQPTNRFSQTVDDYIRYRPGYPPALIGFMKSELGLAAHSVVADVGSGTGKLTEALLPHCRLVYAVEPNAPMRLAAESLLEECPGFRSVAGTAEMTNLPGASVDIVTAAQAFHWFDADAFRRECHRILRPGGMVMLVWNDRVDASSPFMEAYEQFLQEYSTDYQQIDLRLIDTAHLDRFFGAGNYRSATFQNVQRFDLEGLAGRYRSCSYALPPHHSQYAAAMHQLGELFRQYGVNDSVEMVYRTIAYCGRPAI